MLTETPLHQRLVAFQTVLLKALVTSQYRLPGHGVTPSYGYFRVLHQLARVLVTSRQAEDYRARLCSHFGLGNFKPRFLSPRRRVVEVLPVNDRFPLMQLLASWLDDWPDQFVAVCMDNLIWDRELLGRMPSLPPWSEQAAQQVTWSNVLRRLFQQWKHEIPDWNPSGSSGQDRSPWLL